MTPLRLTRAQQRVLDFLTADTSGEFVVVPASVTRYNSPLDALVKARVIEEKWCPATLPPGSFEMRYRIVV